MKTLSEITEELEHATPKRIVEITNALVEIPEIRLYMCSYVFTRLSPDKFEMCKRITGGFL